MTVETTIQTRYNEIQLDEQGILRVVCAQLCEIDLEEVMACYQAYEKLGCRQQRTVQLIHVRKGVTLTKEARDYAAKNGKDYFKASAVIGNSLTTRLIVNFFSLLYPHAVPLKMFSNEKDALKWLEKYK